MFDVCDLIKNALRCVSPSFSLLPGVQSRKPLGMPQPFFGCLTNRIAQEQHFTKSSIPCMRLQKQQQQQQ